MSMPKTDSAAVRWMRAFADEIARDFAGYRITEEQSQAISRAVDSFEAAYATASDRTTRRPEATMLKNDARSEAMRICRQYAQQINHHWETTDLHRLALGLRPKSVRKPLDLARTAPPVRIVVTPSS